MIFIDKIKGLIVLGLFNFLKNKKDDQNTTATSTTVKPTTTTGATAKPTATTGTTAKPTATTGTTVKPTAIVKPIGELQIIIGENPVTFSDGKPYAEGNHIMVPIRELATHLGAKVSWDAKTKTAILSDDDDKVEVVVGASSAIVNGKTVSTGTTAIIKNERIFLPIKFLAENLGATYNYDAVNKIVTIS